MLSGYYFGISLVYMTQVRPLDSVIRGDLFTFTDFQLERLVHAGILLSCNCSVNPVSGSRQGSNKERVEWKIRKKSAKEEGGREAGEVC